MASRGVTWPGTCEPCIGALTIGPICFSTVFDGATRYGVHVTFSPRLYVGSMCMELW